VCWQTFLVSLCASGVCEVNICLCIQVCELWIQHRQRVAVFTDSKAILWYKSCTWVRTVKLP